MPPRQGPPKSRRLAASGACLTCDLQGPNTKMTDRNLLQALHEFIWSAGIMSSGHRLQQALHDGTHRSAGAGDHSDRLHWLQALQGLPASRSWGCSAWPHWPSTRCRLSTQ